MLSTTLASCAGGMMVRIIASTRSLKAVVFALVAFARRQEASRSRDNGWLRLFDLWYNFVKLPSPT